MKLRIRWPRRRGRVDELAAAAAVGSAIGKALRDGGPIMVNHAHTYGARPPLPKLERLVITWEMQNGQEFKSFIPLNGFREYTMPWPGWLTPGPGSPNFPPYLIRFEAEYQRP